MKLGNMPLMDHRPVTKHKSPGDRIVVSFIGPDKTISCSEHQNKAKEDQDQPAEQVRMFIYYLFDFHISYGKNSYSPCVNYIRNACRFSTCRARSFITGSLTDACVCYNTENNAGRNRARDSEASSGGRL